jgi:hypothetical protein
MREAFTKEVRLKKKDLTVLIENLLKQEEIHWLQQGEPSCSTMGIAIQRTSTDADAPMLMSAS